MFEVLKTTVLLQKIHHLDAIALQPEDSLTMACRGGAVAAGLTDEIGAIVKGRKADVVIVDLESVFIAPVHRVASALVFNATPADVSHVIVDGRIVIDEGNVTFLDESELLAEATVAAQQVFARANVHSRLNPK